jgi:hypothetical protein
MAKKKQIKKEEEKRKKELRQTLDSDQSVKNTIITLVIVVIVFVLFYFITDFILNKSRKLNYKEPTASTVEIQYSEILASQVFKQKETEYYVLFYDFKGNHKSYYDQIATDTTKKIYKVNIGSPFNKGIVSEKTNKSVQRYEDLKVKEATLIKINNGKNVFYFEGSLLYIKDNIK